MAGQDPTDDELSVLWERALSGDAEQLAERLAAASGLPGPRANLGLAHRFADRARATAPWQRRAAMAVLAAWLRAAPEEPDARSEYLAAVAALGAGALLATVSDPEVTALLTSAAQDPRWRVRELAATGLQRVLAADWPRGLGQARTWLGAGPLLARAAVAGVAEPPLLHDPVHASDACAVVEEAVELLLAVPASDRRDPDVRVLRKALGYAVSVVAAAHPDGGVPMLERLADSPDSDARWVVRENLTKARLGPLADRLAGARDAVSRS
jgi:hypothetical protein